MNKAAGLNVTIGTPPEVKESGINSDLKWNKIQIKSEYYEECLFCGHYFDDIIDHIKREHFFKCTKCKKKFSNVQKYEEHLQIANYFSKQKILKEKHDETQNQLQVVDQKFAAITIKTSVWNHLGQQIRNGEENGEKKEQKKNLNTAVVDEEKALEEVLVPAKKMYPKEYFCFICMKGPFKRWKYVKAHQIRECGKD